MFLYKHAIKITNASVSYNCTGYLCLQIQNKALVTGSHKYSTGRGIGKSSKLKRSINYKIKSNAHSQTKTVNYKAENLQVKTDLLLNNHKNSD